VAWATRSASSTPPAAGRKGASSGARAAESFDAWHAGDYLRDYYTRVDEDAVHTLAFLVRELARRGRVANRALAFGVGPTVHHLLALAPWAESIDAADYLHGNLREVRRWLRREPDAHDWSPFAAHVLACESSPHVGAAGVHAREALTRGRVVRLLPCDASCNPALAGRQAGPDGYDIVMSCFCAESATGDKAAWARYMRNILRLLRPGGQLLMAALRRCSGYTIGRQVFPAAAIDEGDIAQLLDQMAFDDPLRRTVEMRRLAGGPLHGYEGIVLLACERLPRTQRPAAAVALDRRRRQGGLPRSGEGAHSDVRRATERSFPGAEGVRIAPLLEDPHAP